MPAFDSEFATADIADALRDRAGMVEAPLIHFGGLRRFAGPCATLVASENPQTIADAVVEPGRGRILVIDGRAVPGLACLGEIMARRALESGWAGVIVFGAIRDSARLARIALGAMALRTTARRPFGTGAPGQREVEISAGGVRFTPGAAIFADADAVLVIAAETTR